jgi:hypothetical protein
MRNFFTRRQSASDPRMDISRLVHHQPVRQRQGQGSSTQQSGGGQEPPTRSSSSRETPPPPRAPLPSSSQRHRSAGHPPHHQTGETSVHPPHPFAAVPIAPRSLPQGAQQSPSNQPTPVSDRPDGSSDVESKRLIRNRESKNNAAEVPEHRTAQSHRSAKRRQHQTGISGWPEEDQVNQQELDRLSNAAKQLHRTQRDKAKNDTPTSGAGPS